MSEKIVAWTTPHMRGERAWMAAAEHLEFRRRPQAMEKLHEHLGHVRDLLRWLEENPPPKEPPR